ncbi:TonB system transport protein ExbD [Halopseudomonas salegens]|uniref:Biopolymer transport protein ExbD n=1 Tax=Halopseudomonas salegens TaxID=1434072 RepID=A0A1H2FBF2_9GAMM|nr:TonB system transport protein ExbD [Halopseudomonas salegens]SDU04625.1 biopolymer transport protein ExbD/biopolymer transport protein TolR [Halopseudomonas salegens]
MGIQFNSGPSVKRHNYQQNAEMNITPFVDVMLVLLIIFMVAAPLATVDIPVDLPSNSATTSPPPTDPVYISVQADGQLFVQEDPVELAALTNRVHAFTNGNPETRMYLRGDQAIDYGTLMRVMNTLQRAGYTRISLVATEDQEF